MRSTSQFILPILVALGLVFTSSCNQDNEPIDDPAGTITYSLNYTTGSSFITLYQGLDLHDSDIPYCTSRLDIRDASMNFGFTSINALDPNIVQWMSINPGMGGEISDLGEMEGLAEVSGIPSGGWTTTASAERGHGFVCRVRAAHDYAAATELPYIYARVYVDSYLLNSTGGIIGARIKYQYPYYP